PSALQETRLIVPSSNTAVEPISQAIVRSLNSNIICIFTRIHVNTVGPDPKATAQFSIETMVAAARLLADAHPDAILWDGTSGMWTGADLDADRELARAMQDATGVPCSTTTLATIEALRLLDIKRLGVAVPYTEALMDKVQDFFGNCGYGWHVSSAKRLDPVPSSNIVIAKCRFADIRDVIERCAHQDSEAVVVACTNWPAAGLVGELEEATGMLIVDSIIVTVWQGFRMVRYEGGVKGWEFENTRNNFDASQQDGEKRYPFRRTHSDKAIVNDMEATTPRINDLREQIKANAVLLFPNIVQIHLTNTPSANAYLYVPPSTAFDIILYYLGASDTTRGRIPSTPSTQAEQREMAYQAMLIYQTPAGPARAAQGNSAMSVEEALVSLLQVTGHCLANRCFGLLRGEGMGRWRAWGDGFVNEEVVGAGDGGEGSEVARGLLEELRRGGVGLGGG
ncbi:GAF domain-containing protein, partial [Teratosphaeria destructans]